MLYSRWEEFRKSNPKTSALLLISDAFLGYPVAQIQLKQIHKLECIEFMQTWMEIARERIERVLRFISKI